MRRNQWIWMVLAIVILLSCCACALLGALIYAGMPESDGFSSGSGGAIAVIPAEGTIMSGSGADGLSSGVVYADTLIEQLDEAVDDPDIGAIVLEINSPGGGVVASADIQRALDECPKPVIASMVEMAASGGYYIACGTDYIMARPATMTGSIGVISQFANAEELLAKLGVEYQTVKTGSHKDEGGIHRELTDEEIAIFQTMLDEALDDFVQVIVDNRGLDEDTVRELADGRIYTGKQAVDLGLIDDLGNLDDAIAVAAEMAGIEGEPDIYYYEQPRSFWSIFGTAADPASRSAELALIRELIGSDGAPTMQYLYTGH